MLTDRQTDKQTGELTGYPSIDKPWLKYYSEEAINAPLPECTIYEYMYDNNKYALDDPAIYYFGKKYTYREMFNQIDSVAAAFSNIGVKKGDVVALLLPNTPESIFCIYGLNKIGAIADMVDLRVKGDDLLRYLNESCAKVAVICDLFESNAYEVLNATSIKTCIVGSPFDSMPTAIGALLKLSNKVKNLRRKRPGCVISWNQFIRSGISTKSTPVGTADDVACIFHTSGTTGTSKGVMITNKNLNSMHIQVSMSGLHVLPGETYLNQVPPFLAYNAFCGMHNPLSQHMTIIVLPDYRPDKFGETISKYKPNQAIAGPADWTNLWEYSQGKDIDYSFLTSCFSGSDSLAQPVKDSINKLLKESGAKSMILEGYGMTEIGASACCNLPQRYVDGSVGVPFPLNTFCAYDNENECEMQYGETGEICMTGPTVMKGYYLNPEETARTLRLHKDGKLWLHSGDLGYISEDGDVFLQGRLKRLIVRHDGFKVSPFQIEKAILTHPDVKACCVVGQSDNVHGRGQLPVAFIVLNSNKKTVIEEIRKICEGTFSERYWPIDYRLINELPLTANGKVDYRSLESDLHKL